MSDNKTSHFSKVGSVDDEFNAATMSAVIADRSSVGKLLVTGADRLDLLHRLSTNNLLDLKPFGARMTVFTTDKGRIVDYVRILVFPDFVILITSPGQENRVLLWIEKYTIMEDIQLKVITSSWTMYSLIGPEAEFKAREMFASSPRSDTVVDLEFANRSIKVDYQRDLSICAVNILVPSEHAPTVLNEMITAGRKIGIATMSSQGYDCFRIFHGIPREERELTCDFNPYETGLEHAISFTKGCYIGQEVIARLDTYQKVPRKLVRLSFSEYLEGCNRATLLSNEGENVGVLSSLAPVQLKGEYLGLGIVRDREVVLGDRLSVATQVNGQTGLVTKQFDRKRS